MPSSSSSSSSRSNRKAALAKFRNAKRKRELGEDDDDLFERSMKEEDDVYDIIEESEYQSLVESRRQREDFVVDDGKSLVPLVRTLQPLPMALARELEHSVGSHVL